MINNITGTTPCRCEQMYMIAKVARSLGIATGELHAYSTREHVNADEP